MNRQYMMTSSSGNIFRVTSPLCGEFTSQRPVTQSFGVFYDLRLNKRLSEQSGGWWFATLSLPLRRHCNGTVHHYEDKEPLVSYDQHNGCWWFGDARSQGIGSHGNGLFPGISTRRIDISLIWTILSRLQSNETIQKHDSFMKLPFYNNAVSTHGSEYPGQSRKVIRKWVTLVITLILMSTIWINYMHVIIKSSVLYGCSSG